MIALLIGTGLRSHDFRVLCRRSAASGARRWLAEAPDHGWSDAGRDSSRVAADRSAYPNRRSAGTMELAPQDEPPARAHHGASLRLGALGAPFAAPAAAQMRYAGLAA